MTHIKRIRTNIPNSQKCVDILLDGKNLIFTGSNGCGKTQLLNHLFDSLENRIVKRKNPDVQELKRRIADNKSRLKTMSKANSDYALYERNIRKWEKEVEEVASSGLELSDVEEFVVRYHEHKALCAKFDATRQATIRESKAAVSKENLIKQNSDRGSPSSAIYFEEYLVSQKAAQAYAESPSIDDDPEKAVKIKGWFDKLQNDFRELFEDPNLVLQFDSNLQAFLIKQENKVPYRFQQLSSGFSSILSIYADLITRVELHSVNPEELNGVVFVDEIDAHLHVSLQRKIFSFLDKAFPNVQFVVTTHSPFVVSSVNNAVIYDLSRLEQVEDLSLYSYEAVLEGLFNVLPISEVLKDKIVEIGEISQSESPDIARLSSLVSQVSPHESKLDSESAFYLKTAKIKINKAKKVGM